MMKTTLLSLLAFVLGLLAGFGPRWVERRVRVSETSSNEKLRAAAKPEASRVGADLVQSKSKAAASDAFAEWEAARGAGRLVDRALRSALLEKMAAVDPRRAWELLVSSGVPVMLPEVELVARAWFEKEARGAAEFGLQLTDAL